MKLHLGTINRAFLSAIMPLLILTHSANAQTHYQVEDTECLYLISLKLYGTTRHWEKIADLNQISNPYQVLTGEKIKIYKPPTLSKKQGEQALLEYWRKYFKVEKFEQPQFLKQTTQVDQQETKPTPPKQITKETAVPHWEPSFERQTHIDPNTLTRSLFLASLGVTRFFININEIMNYSALTTTAKVSFRYLLFPPHWDLGVNFFSSIVSLSNSPNDLTGKSMGANLRAGYAFPFIKEPWRLTLLLGINYSSSTLSEDYLNYSYVRFFQLFPTLRRVFNNGDLLNIYLKFVPLTDGFAILDFNQREVASGISYVFLLKNKRPLSVSFDYSNTKVSLTREVHINSYSLSVGYGF